MQSAHEFSVRPKHPGFWDGHRSFYYVGMIQPVFVDLGRTKKAVGCPKIHFGMVLGWLVFSSPVSWYGNILKKR
jgi:hypothetical protein